ncbi:MAG TPA: dienelactone hydrolase family protein, partial [Candidatus Thermoplasmatota archaeon]|nr:dienelactone hydrolase family protein [Candidatus Thermoplasmatota archaeon]
MAARLAALWTVFPLLAVMLAGCASDAGDREPTPASPPSSPTMPATPPSPPGSGTAGGVTALAFREHPEHGRILVDQRGHTLYIFTNDERDRSRCLGSCLDNWPPALASSMPTVPDRIAGNVTLATPAASGSSGARQVAYEGWPLYYWIGDRAAGQATGDGVNGVWFVVREPPAQTEAGLDPWGSGTLQAAGTDVEYMSGVTGYHAKPTTGTATTGVVMVHEWWGLNDEIKAMADRLASHGYQVLAVDLFGKVAATPDEARAQVMALDQQAATANMRAAAAYLRDQGAT